MPTDIWQTFIETKHTLPEVDALELSDFMRYRGWHPAGVRGTGACLEIDVHELCALMGPRKRDVDALLQSPPQGLIDVPGKVGGCQDHDLLSFSIILGVDAINLQNNTPNAELIAARTMTCFCSPSSW